MTFEVGDKVRRVKHGYLGIKVGDVAVVKNVFTGPNELELEGFGDGFYDADCFELVEAAVPDVAKLQEELNKWAFAMAESQTQPGLEHRERLLLQDRVVIAARALQTALQPPEPEVLYSVHYKNTSGKPTIPLDLPMLRLQPMFRLENINALHPWDGTRFGEPITGNQLAALLAGES
jgi:hypothetical protein